MANSQDRIVAECVQWIVDAEDALVKARTALGVLSNSVGVRANQNGTVSLPVRDVMSPLYSATGQLSNKDSPLSPTSPSVKVPPLPMSLALASQGLDTNEVQRILLPVPMGAYGTTSPLVVTNGVSNGVEDADLKQDEEKPKVFMDQVVFGGEAEEEWAQDMVQKSTSEDMGGMTRKLQRKKSVVVAHSKKCGGCGQYFGMPVLHPESRIRTAWDLIGLLFIIYETYAIPFYIAFKVKPHSTELLWITICCINSYFMMDIGMSCITAFRSDMGIVIMVPSRIIKRYARTWLLPDVISGIPWEWMSGDLPVSGSTAQLSKMLRLLRVARLLRLLKIDILSDRMKMAIEASTTLVFVSGVMRVLFMLFGITHWAACIWYIIGSRSTEANNWVDAKVPPGAGILESYCYAMYFTLTTMTTVGYGDITPSNYSEVCFTSVLLLVATVVFATLMGSLTDLIGNLNSEKHVQSEKVLMLSRYMTWRSVPRDLFCAVRKHLLYLWETNKGYDAYEEEIKDQLPPILRKELCFHIYGRILRGMPFLSWLKDFEICLKELANVVQSDILSRGDVIFRVGEDNTEITVLLVGSVRISLNESLFHEPDAEDEDHVDEHHHEDKALLNDAFSLEVPRNAGHNEKAASTSGPAKASSGTSPSAKKKTTSLFQSVIFQAAGDALKVEDKRRNWAAKVIQGRYRLKCFLRQAAVRRHAATLQTKIENAPAYLGESCLWHPVDTWVAGPPPTYTYSARCEQRCELLKISRHSLQELFARFDPWLLDRFDYFQGCVVTGMPKAGVRTPAKQTSVRFADDLQDVSPINGPTEQPSISPTTFYTAGTAQDSGVLLSGRGISRTGRPTSSTSPLVKASPRVDSIADAIVAPLLGGDSFGSSSAVTGDMQFQCWDASLGAPLTARSQKKQMQFKSAELAQRSREAVSRLMEASRTRTMERQRREEDAEDERKEAQRRRSIYNGDLAIPLVPKRDCRY